MKFFSLIFKIYFIFWLHRVFGAARGLSLVAVVVRGLLIAVASLVAEHGL